MNEDRIRLKTANVRSDLLRQYIARAEEEISMLQSGIADAKKELQQLETEHTSPAVEHAVARAVRAAEEEEGGCEHCGSAPSCIVCGKGTAKGAIRRGLG